MWRGFPSPSRAITAASPRITTPGSETFSDERSSRALAANPLPRRMRTSASLACSSCCGTPPGSCTRARSVVAPAQARASRVRASRARAHPDGIDAVARLCRRQQLPVQACVPPSPMPRSSPSTRFAFAILAQRQGAIAGAEIRRHQHAVHVRATAPRATAPSPDKHVVPWPAMRHGPASLVEPVAI